MTAAALRTAEMFAEEMLAPRRCADCGTAEEHS